MKPLYYLLTISLISLISSTPTFASQPEHKKRPQIGLVLSGGGARGAAHIGVIRVLEELRIPIDHIAGTSMGAIVGGLYASGMSADELEKLLTGIDWQDAFKDKIPRRDRSFRRKSDDNLYLIKSKPGISDQGELKLPSGLLQGQKIDLILKKAALPVSHINKFDNFAIPYRAVAGDIVTGNAVVLDSGDLALAMRASMSVDGGVSNNLPVDVARQMGADILIVVDISTPLLTRDELKSAVAITTQLTGILTRRNTEQQIATLTERDILLTPDLGDITSASFDKAAEAIPKGIAAARQQLGRLQKFSISEPAYAAYRAARAGRRAQEKQPVIIDFVRFDNQSRLSDEVLAARLDLRPGEPLDIAGLEQDIAKIYGLELFENITYEIIEEDNISFIQSTS